MSTDTERVLFTSESVTNGHPDKLCDAISDAILDACIAQDPQARVACETLVKGTDKDSVIILAGEITVAGDTPDYAGVARATAASIGYTSQDVGMDAATCDVEVRITTQSPDISGGVSQGNVEQGAGDQGMMFGYATNESEGYASLKGTYMPLPALLSQTLTRRLTEVREKGILPWARPDGKSQVTIEYSDDGKPVRILTVVIALQHDDLSEELGSMQAMLDYIKDEVKQHVVDPVIPSELVDSDTNVIVNGAGPFIRGGPYADAGLTGRKIIVDTYGGMGRHGGGAFSGKDPSKVDRSAAYAARWAAKHVIAAGLAEECEIQLAYAIGVAEPVSVRVTTNGTTADGITEEEIGRRIRSAFDFRPWEIIRELDLLRPIYTETSSGGHFGRESVGEIFPWERLEEARLSALRQE